MEKKIITDRNLKVVQKTNFRDHSKQTLRKYLLGEIDEDDLDEEIEEDLPVVLKEKMRV